MADLARVALIDGALRKLFCDEEEPFQEFLKAHHENSPYEQCPDNFCGHARRQADDIIAVLTEAGFKIVEAG